MKTTVKIKDQYSESLPEHPSSYDIHQQDLSEHYSPEPNMSNFDDEYKVSTIDNQRKINHKKIKKNNRDSKVTKEKKDRATKTKEDSSENTTGKSHRKNLAMNNEWLTNVLLNQLSSQKGYNVSEIIQMIPGVKNGQKTLHRRITTCLNILHRVGKIYYKERKAYLVEGNEEMKEKSIPLFSLKLADEKSENVLIGKDKIEIAKNELTYFRSNSKKVGILKENLQALLEKLEAMNRQ